MTRVTHKNTFIRRQVIEILYAYELLGKHADGTSILTKEQISQDYQDKKFQVICDFSEAQDVINLEIDEPELLEQSMQEAISEMDELEFTEANLSEQAAQTCQAIYEKCAQLDALIDKYSVNWAFNRIPIIDRNILRLALYEILFVEDVPISVSINEAVELSKDFGTDQSYKFINGILGEVVRTEDIKGKIVEEDFEE